MKSVKSFEKIQSLKMFSFDSKKRESLKIENKSNRIKKPEEINWGEEENANDFIHKLTLILTHDKN